jgi:hypothetical protein
MRYPLLSERALSRNQNSPLGGATIKPASLDKQIYEKSSINEYKDLGYYKGPKGKKVKSVVFKPGKSYTTGTPKGVYLVNAITERLSRNN